jgi:hypothetical protein
MQGLLTSELHSHLWILKEATALSFPRKRELDVINKYITGKIDTRRLHSYILLRVVDRGIILLPIQIRCPIRFSVLKVAVQNQILYPIGRI